VDKLLYGDLDGNMDGFVANKDRYKRAFQKLDLDKNGCLDPDELKKLVDVSACLSVFKMIPANCLMGFAGADFVISGC
jgi:hypothetical protein